MADQFILSNIQQGVGIITFNRPDKFHSFNTAMAKQLQKALDEMDTDESVRCILITATGKAFCAGQDLSEAIDPNGPGIEQIVDENYNPVIRRFRSINKPILCAVNGVAAGAGANIAIACDIVIAAESATFVQAFSKIGLIPDSGGTFILPRLIGLQRSAALMMLADKLTAAEAVQMGMIYKSYPDTEFADAAMAMAVKLASMPTKGLALTKQLLNAAFTNSLEEQLQMEMKVQAQAAATADHQEGVKAFLEKRTPVFQGR